MIFAFQDFDDWDDVGLNMSRPPDLLHLYRDFGKHVIPPPIITETTDVACGDDSVHGDQPEEVEADLGMVLDEERQNRVRITKIPELWSVHTLRYLPCDVVCNPN